MSKKKNRQEVETEITDEQVETGAEGVSESESEVENEAPSARGRAVMLTDPETGEQVARKDVIKEAYEGGMSRSEIRKLLAEKYKHEVAYQIIFATVKNLKAPAKPKAQ